MVGKKRAGRCRAATPDSEASSSRGGDSTSTRVSVNAPVKKVPREVVQLQELTDMLWERNEVGGRIGSNTFKVSYFKNIGEVRQLVYGLLQYVSCTQEDQYHQLFQDGHLSFRLNGLANWSKVLETSVLDDKSGIGGSVVRGNLARKYERLLLVKESDPKYKLACLVGAIICFFHRALWSKDLDHETRLADFWAKYIIEDVRLINGVLGLDFDCAVIKKIGIEKTRFYGFVVNKSADTGPDPESVASDSEDFMEMRPVVKRTLENYENLAKAKRKLGELKTAEKKIRLDLGQNLEAQASQEMVIKELTSDLGYVSECLQMGDAQMKVWVNSGGVINDLKLGFQPDIQRGELRKAAQKILAKDAGRESPEEFSSDEDDESTQDRLARPLRMDDVTSKVDKNQEDADDSTNKGGKGDDQIGGEKQSEIPNPNPQGEYGG